MNSLMRALFLFPTMVPLVAVASLFFFIFLPGVGLLDHYLANSASGARPGWATRTWRSGR